MREHFINAPLTCDHSSVVYALMNTSNRKIYIGKTDDFSQRIKYHWYALKAQKHSIKELQEDFDSGHRFLVICLRRVATRNSITKNRPTRDTDRWLSLLEKEYIQEFQAVEFGYNRKEPAYPLRSEPHLRPFEALAETNSEAV